MSSSLAIRALFDTERTLGHAAISGAYAKVGSTLANSAIWLRFFNDTDVTVTFSADGTNDSISIGTGKDCNIPVQALKSERGGSMQLAAGTQFWVKGAPTAGNVYIDVIYASTFGAQ